MKGRTIKITKLLEFIDSLYISDEDEHDLNAIEALHNAGLNSSEIVNGFKNANDLKNIDLNGIINFIANFETYKPLLENLAAVDRTGSAIEAISNIDELGLSPLEVANAIYKAHLSDGDLFIPDGAISDGTNYYMIGSNYVTLGAV